MALPLFYSAGINVQEEQHMLTEDTSRHIIQVLRMKKDDQLSLTNGNGCTFTTKIIDDNKKKVWVQVIDKTFHPAQPGISIGISLVKNVQRFEWFLEKAVEIGVSEIFPIICNRTEKQQFRTSRLQGIMVSAMLQSQQAWRATLHEPIKFQELIAKPLEGDALIAHCIAEEKRTSINAIAPLNNPLILIGPEGDFTKQEIEMAFQHNYKPVTLGNTRLRTETAGMVAITLLNQFNAHLPD